MQCIINVFNTDSRINLIVGGKLKVYLNEKVIAELELTSYAPGHSNSRIEMEKSNFLKVSPNNVERVKLGFRIENQ